MRRIIALLLMQALLIALVVITQAPAGAHAVLVSSSPKDNATLSESPKSVVLRFDAKIEKKVTHVTLLDGRRHKVALPAMANGYMSGPADQLTIAMPELKPGSYRLQYQVMATDGHISPGLIRFTVAERKRH